MHGTIKGIKAIYFDTSDTLYQSEAMEAAYPQKLNEYVAKKVGITIDEAKQRISETAEKLKATEKHVTKVRTAAEFGISRPEVHDNAFCLVDPHRYLKPDKELDNVMAELAKHYKLGIISNLRRSHMLEVFNALGLSPDYFPLMVTEDTVREIKPDPEPFLKAIELAGCPAEQCLYVGDSPSKDMKPAKEAGMKTVLVAKISDEADLSHADAVVTSVKDIPSLLS